METARRGKFYILKYFLGIISAAPFSCNVVCAKIFVSQNNTKMKEMELRMTVILFWVILEASGILLNSEFKAGIALRKVHPRKCLLVFPPIYVHSPRSTSPLA